MGSPVLWSRSTEEMVLVGTCNSKITVLDRRDWTTKVRTLTYLRQPAIDAVIPVSWSLIVVSIRFDLERFSLFLFIE